MKMLRSVPVVLAIAVISGCATMSEEECLTADWHAVGFGDGASGVEANHIERYRKDCAKAGVTPDTEAWREGRAEGLLDYCVPAIGYRQGRNNQQYNGVCPAHLEPQFLAAYHEGKVLGTLERRVREAESDLASKQREIERLHQSVRDAEKLLLSDDATEEQRRDALDLVKTSQESLGGLEKEVTDLQIELAGVRKELESLLADQPY